MFVVSTGMSTSGEIRNLYSVSVWAEGSYSGWRIGSSITEFHPGLISQALILKVKVFQSCPTLCDPMN